MRAAPPYGTYWVPIEPGAVLAGPHPVLAPEGGEDRVRRLVTTFGVRHFVDLSGLEDWMPRYEGFLRQLAPRCDYTRYPIRDRWLPEDPGRLHELLQRMIADGERGQITYVHCQAGLGRTGTVVGCLLREMGFKGDAALDELVRLRWEARLHEGSPEFEEQREFVRGWREFAARG
jgi:protein-tyrosine phosphatase